MGNTVQYYVAGVDAAVMASGVDFKFAMVLNLCTFKAVR